MLDEFEVRTSEEDKDYYVSCTLGEGKHPNEYKYIVVHNSLPSIGAIWYYENVYLITRTGGKTLSDSYIVGHGESEREALNMAESRLERGSKEEFIYNG